MAEPPLSILCVEPTFPGRLGGVADWLVRKRGYRVNFYCGSADPPDRWPSSVGRGLDVIRYDALGAAIGPSVSWERLLERGLAHAAAAYRVLDGRNPRPVDVVLGRSAGLGSTLFVPAVRPRLPVLQMFDYYLHPRANDLADEAGPGTPAEYFHWRRSANAGDLLDLENGVVPWAVTAWQRGLYPPEYQDDFLTLFDGVDLSPRPPVGLPRVIAGRPVPMGAKVVTFVAKSLGRIRGFDRFVGLVNRLLAERPDVIAVVVGDRRVHHAIDVNSFGKDYVGELLAHQPWAEPSRVWLLGAVSRAVVGEVLAGSDLHVYPSRAYPVSRSLVEAMGAGCPVMAWDHPPAREFVTDGATGRLVSSDGSNAADIASELLTHDASRRSLGDAAAATVKERFPRDATLPRLAAKLAELAGA